MSMEVLGMIGLSSLAAFLQKMNRRSFWKVEIKNHEL
jgi:hypothetical protein